MTLCSPPYYSTKEFPVRDTLWPDGWRGQLGTEPTMEIYIQHLAAVCCEVWRVLKPNGTFWLNLGDNYYNSRPGPVNPQSIRGIRGYAGEPQHCPRRANRPGSLKRKELMLVPFRVALALQDMGWYLRAEIVWHKTNSLPESVTDRPIRSHESIFLLTKQPQCFYNHEPIKDVWSIPYHRLDEPHYAYFPKEWAERCIRLGRREGDLVLDCFGAPRQLVLRHRNLAEDRYVWNWRLTIFGSRLTN